MHFPRLSSASVVFGCLIHLCATSLFGAQPLTASAVDIHGKRHFDGSWFSDCVALGRPEYPVADRAQWHQGEGLFRITVDVKTGLVSKVAVIKSTGFTSLDNSAIAALRKCRWKPGRWKEIDFRVNFMMTNR
jgi:TonB family protein